jgi:hypothetical protein
LLLGGGCQVAEFLGVAQHQAVAAAFGECGADCRAVGLAGSVFGAVFVEAGLF